MKLHNFFRYSSDSTTIFILLLLPTVVQSQLRNFEWDITSLNNWPLYNVTLKHKREAESVHDDTKKLTKLHGAELFLRS